MEISFPKYYLLILATLCLVILASTPLRAQDCPPNIDFEKGNFDGWTCYAGNVSAAGQVNNFLLTNSNGPVPGRHTIIPANSGNDPYGGFSMSSPNGSNYCIRLGNDQGGGEGEAISYEFTIPASRDKYSLVYHYAVVFQDPNHQQYEQPRMEIEITNVSTGTIIDCASFTFIPFGSGLPGFFQSSVEVSNTPIWCKDWTAVSINLDNNAGRTIRLTFRTGDCTFRRHFGYAYIDVDSECSGEFVGASYCPDDSLVNVLAPYGFMGYTWLDENLNRVLGNQQILVLKPPPPSGTTVNVKLVPYPGYGCPQTMTAKLINNLSVKANAGPDTVSCNNQVVQLGERPRPGLVYNWSPPTGLSNPGVANPFALPNAPTRYVLSVRSQGGGCLSQDTVFLNASVLDTSISLLGNPDICIGSGDTALLQVKPTLTIQWLLNNQPIPGATSTQYKVLQTGEYRASLTDTLGCALTTKPIAIDISSVPEASLALNSDVQCLVGNRFVFTNNSTNDVGTMQYRWELGNGQTRNTRHLDYSYDKPGTYDVKMVVRTNAACADSQQVKLVVHPNAIANFEAPQVCTLLPTQIENLTDENLGSPVHYRWNVGGLTGTDREPPQRVFAAPGNYQVSLQVFTDQCPTPPHTLVKTMVVERPLPGMNHAIQFAVENQPYTLITRRIGDSVLWSPARYLNAANVYTPVFNGPANQFYTITMTTKGGCITVDSLLVQTVKNAEIYVATGFTPNGDGKNDFLRPVLMGIKELRYFRIFNRWGQIVFETRAEKPGWDGRVQGVMQASAAYVWMAEGIGYDGKTYVRRGTSVLIK